MRHYLFLLAINLSIGARSQDLSYTQYNVRDGLAGSVVYCAAEDKDGFLWFGTESGVSRYDGTHFRNLTTADGLPDNEILKIFVDSKNRVWMAPFRNSICYYQRGELHNQENDPVLRQLSINSEITSVTEDRSGDIFLTEGKGLHILYHDQTVRTMRQVSGIGLELAIAGGLNQDGLFTFFSQMDHTNYEQYVAANGALIRTGQRSFVGRSVSSAALTPAVNVFSNSDTFYFNPASGGSFKLPFPPSVNSLSVIGDSLFALNTANGTLLYNLQNRQQRAHFLEGRPINATFRDSEGNFWLMSAGGGVFRVSSLTFRNFIFGGDNGLSVTCIQPIGDSLYIGTERSCLWRSDPGMRKIVLQKKDWHSNNLKRILAIVPLEKKELLLGTDGGLFKLDSRNNDSCLDYISVKTVVRCDDAGGTPGDRALLISSMKRVELWDYPDLKLRATVLKGRSTCSWRQDSIFYVGTINGLYKVGPDGRAFFMGTTYPVLNFRIVAMAPSPDGTLWVATSGQGIAGIRDGRLLYLLTVKDGLSSNTCRTIFISGADVWVGTDKGLNRVHPQGKGFHITTFGKEDGLSSDVINAVYVNKDDVYVGAAGGMTCFNISQLAERSFCKLRITSVQAVRHIWNFDTSGLRLPHRESAIRVDFAGISYRSTGDITYRYRLNGLDSGWQTTRETFLSYPTLPSGDYILELVATNKFGVESNPVRIVFTVEKLLWEKGWFIMLAGALLAGMIWLMVWWRIRQLKRKNAEKLSISNRMAELEQMSLRAQMNPHFIFNSLNSIQKYVMEKDIVGANKFITDFARLIRLTLEINSKSRISIDEEVRYISSYLELERARFGNTFRYEVIVGPGIDVQKCYIPPMLLQPYVENSIRHGLRHREDDEGVIHIRFVNNGEHLVCTIEDNGVGRKQAQRFKSLSPIEYQSQGMTLTARRIEMINKVRLAPMSVQVEDIETKDGRPAGTRVILFFPLRYVKNESN